MTALSRGHIRIRLTIWHVSVLALVLLVYSASASFFLLRDLRRQLIRYAIQDIETVEGLLYFDNNGRLSMNEDYHNHPESKLVLDRFLEVRSPEGTVLYRNERLGNRSLGGAAIPNEGEGGYSEREMTLEPGLRVQMVSRRHSIAGRPTLIRLAYSEEPLRAGFRDQLLALLLPVPLVLALAGMGGYVLASRALRPIQEMARRAEEITGERLNARLPVEPSDGELADLARVFNGMLARLELSFEQLRRFTSDASHELRTPLAAIRSVGEVGLQKKGTVEEYRDIIGSMLEESGRLTKLVESLLTISRADAGQLHLHPTGFPAMNLCRECSSLLEVLLEEKDQRLIVTGDENAVIHGDWLLLHQALLNIVHNAIKYSPTAGVIAMRVTHEPSGEVSIEVQDSGPGIPETARARVFDRFYRVDAGRSRAAGGSGLGLSIAQWTVEAHGGKISLESSEGEGCTFRITLPALPADRSRSVAHTSEAVRL